MNILGVLFSALLFSALVIAILTVAATRIGLTDRPGGHKQHEEPVPLAGGSGIYAVVVVVLLVALPRYPGQHDLILSLLLASTLLFAVGLIDDIRPLGVRVRFGTQGLAGLLTALWGGLMLKQVGALVSFDMITLGMLALPFTLFAIAGVINALNMMDGIDGLSGSLSVISLAMLAVIASRHAGAGVYLFLILALIGAVSGFLLFNLRCCRRRKALVFMGDAGSTLLGFLFACLFTGLSQEPLHAMSPVIALWLFAVPLFDTVAIMLRRLWLGKSPFRADRSHMHHLLLDAGFTVPQSVLVLAGLQLAMGLAGLVGWYYALPDALMFTAFIGLFGIYFYLTSRPWRLVPALRALHRALDLPLTGVTEVFIGDLPEGDPENVLRHLLGSQADCCDYRLYAYDNGTTGRHTIYAIAPVGHPKEAVRMIRDIKTRIGGGEEIIVRQFVPRDTRNDRRNDDHRVPQDQRRVDRRGGRQRLLNQNIPPLEQPVLVSENPALQRDAGSLSSAASVVADEAPATTRKTLSG